MQTANFGGAEVDADVEMFDKLNSNDSKSIHPETLAKIEEDETSVKVPSMKFDSKRSSAVEPLKGTQFSLKVLGVNVGNCRT